MTKAQTVSKLCRLLVASDLSPRAEKALARATQIAREHEAALTVLHVLEDGRRGGIQSAATIEDALRQTLAALSPQYRGPLTVRVVAGKPFVEILHCAREEASDLIVVGAPGSHVIKDLFFVATAEKIVRQGDRPILVVKRAPQGPYHRILAAVDFSDDSRRALDLALQLAPQADVHVLHGYPGFEGPLKLSGVTASDLVRYRRQWAKEARQELEHFLREVNCHDRPVIHILKEGRDPYLIAEIITETTRRLQADLVAVGATSRIGRLSYLLLGSIAERVLHKVRCDVLVAHAEAIRFELP